MFYATIIVYLYVKEEVCLPGALTENEKITLHYTFSNPSGYYDLPVGVGCSRFHGQY